MTASTRAISIPEGPLLGREPPDTPSDTGHSARRIHRRLHGTPTTESAGVVPKTGHLSAEPKRYHKERRAQWIDECRDFDSAAKREYRTTSVTMWAFFEPLISFPSQRPGRSRSSASAVTR